MSEVEVRPDVDLNELYDQDVPCSKCGKSAQFISFGHGCPVSGREQPPYFRCLKCWQKTYKHYLARIASQGFICCLICENHFPTPESFSDYRPF
jgi:hypothetical protein